MSSFSGRPWWDGCWGMNNMYVQVELTLEGHTYRPELQLIPSLVDMGCPAAGRTVVRKLLLKNISHASVTYQFGAMGLGTFSLDQTQGSVSPGSQVEIVVRFCAAVPAHYWKRLSCDVLGGPSVTVDLIGTCYTAAIHPIPLVPSNVWSFLQMSTSELKILGLEGLQPLKKGNHEQSHLQLEMQFPWNLVNISPDHLMFRPRGSNRTCATETVQVLNRTRVTVTAIIAEGQEALNDTHLQVHPLQLEIEPGCIGEFNVRLLQCPANQRGFTSRALEVVVFKQEMRDYRTVSEADILPPWSSTIQIHLQSSGAVPTPVTTIMPKCITFQPTLCGSSTFKTVCLRNDGDMAVLFEVLTGLLPASISCLPHRGTIDPQQFQLFTLRFLSDTPVVETTHLEFMLNGSKDHIKSVPLSGSAYEPSLSMEGGSLLCFKPTGVGSLSQRNVKLCNTSKVPLVFKWEGVPAGVAVQPAQGTLLGQESQSVTWTFQPLTLTSMHCKASCIYRGAIRRSDPPYDMDFGATGPDGYSTSPQGEYEYTVELKGKATPSFLTLEPAVLDLGPIPVGQTSRHTMTLKNCGEGNLHYRLCWKVLRPEPSTTALEGGLPNADLGSPETVTRVSPSKGSPPPQVTNGDRLVAQARQSEGSFCASSGLCSGLAREGYSADPGVVAGACLAVSDSPLPSASSIQGPEVLRGIEIQLENASGVLPGRSSTQLAILLTPKRCMACQVEVGLALGDDSTTETKDFTTDGVGRVLPLALVSAAAVVPKLAVTDVARAGFLKSWAEQQASVAILNARLDGDQSKEELDVLNWIQKGTFTTARAQSILSPHIIDLGNCLLDSGVSSLNLQVFNPGPLEASFELQGSSDVDQTLELENWVEATKPTNDVERLEEFVITSRILEIQPRAGRLSAGKTCTLQVCVRPVRVGTFSISLLLVVHGGRLLPLKVEARVVPQGFLELDPTLFTVNLGDANIGRVTEDCSAQTFLIPNKNPTTIEYKIEAENIENSMSYGFEVFKVEQPWTGTVAAYSSIPISVRFQPIEKRFYKFTVPLTFATSERVEVEFAGKGEQSDGRRRSDLTNIAITTPPDVIYSAPLFKPPQWLARLLDGEAVFQDIPQQTPAWAPVTLYNLSSLPLNYKWDTSAMATWYGGRLSFKMSPPSGVLPGGASLLCRLLCSAGTELQHFHGEAVVTVNQQDEGPPPFCDWKRCEIRVQKKQSTGAGGM
eukprot:jgi/Botrbrau1/10951/Bobra.0383s0006.1